MYIYILQNSPMIIETKLITIYKLHNIMNNTRCNYNIKLILNILEIYFFFWVNDIKKNNEERFECLGGMPESEVCTNFVLAKYWS